MTSSHIQLRTKIRCNLTRTKYSMYCCQPTGRNVIYYLDFYSSIGRDLRDVWSISTTSIDLSATATESAADYPRVITDIDTERCSCGPLIQSFRVRLCVCVSCSRSCRTYSSFPVQYVAYWFHGRKSRPPIVLCDRVNHCCSERPKRALTVDKSRQPSNARATDPISLFIECTPATYNLSSWNCQAESTADMMQPRSYGCIQIDRLFLRVQMIYVSDHNGT